MAPTTDLYRGDGYANYAPAAQRGEFAAALMEMCRNCEKGIVLFFSNVSEPTVIALGFWLQSLGRESSRRSSICRLGFSLISGLVDHDVLCCVLKFCAAGKRLEQLREEVRISQTVSRQAHSSSGYQSEINYT